MSEPWWGREAAGASGRIVRGADGSEPELLRADPSTVRRALRGRVAAFTPEWSNPRDGDPGDALMRLFALQLEPVLRRVNRLPEAGLVRFLDAGGVRPLPPTPAETLVRFTVAPAAPDAPRIPAGAQLTAPPASGSGDPVTFETEADVVATAAEILEIHVQEAGLMTAVDPGSATPFAPFGRHARAGRALWLGLSPDAPVGETLTVGVVVASPPGAPPPATAGGVAPLPLGPVPLLRWEVLDAGRPEAAAMNFDETGGLVRSGAIELRMPGRWRPGRPAPLGDGEPRRWLRLRIVHGSFATPPSLRSVFLNAARAAATRTIRGEVLELMDGGGAAAGRTVMRVTQTPVLPGSAIIEVDEGVAGDGFGVLESQASAPPAVRRWREVDDLAAYDPSDRVFTVDAVSGEVTFGDGEHGMRVPRGFRNVVAARYRVGGGSAGAVAADQVTTMLTSVPFVTGVTNPVPASGGSDAEPPRRLLSRGPRELRAHGRAVTVADYEVLALNAPGAQVARAHAMAGMHPSHPGMPVPGVVGVLVVPPDRGEGPPTPDEGTLRNVARHLADASAPAGVEVVTAAPRYHRVAVETRVVIDPAADPSDVIRRVVATLDEYLHPLTGGDDGLGWPFGGALRYVPLVQRVLGVADVRAVDRLSFVFDGVRVAPCGDRALRAGTLVWPDAHEVAAEPGTPS